MKAVMFKLEEGYFPFHWSENSQQSAWSGHREAGTPGAQRLQYLFFNLGGFYFILFFSVLGSRNETLVRHCSHGLSKA